jgi:hypothetical protein
MENENLKSKNHRDYQSEEAKRKISEALIGHEVKEETRKKISNGNKGKKRSEEVRKAISERMKGKTPLKASEAAKEWVKNNGGGYWKNHELPEEAKKNIREAIRKRGVPIVCHYPDGTTKTFSTLSDCATEIGVGVGSIHNNLKFSNEDHKLITGHWFEKIEKES